jgi:hypothetical protein
VVKSVGNGHLAPFACVICRIRTLLPHLVTHV